MSLKHKCEEAALALIDAGSFAGELFTSQEAQTMTLTVPCAVAIAEIQGPAVLAPDGGATGLQRVRLVVGIKGSADANDELSDPVAAHSANVELVRDALQIDTLAADLSAAQSGFTIIGAVPAGPPAPDPEERNFVDFSAWDLVACEDDI